jgi:ribosomal protein S18 acetylase RimI-like enzyme
MVELTTRRAAREDAELISRLSTETFWETYSENPNSDNDDIQAYMSEAYAVGLLEQELDHESIVFLLAEFGGETAGYARLLIGSEADVVKGEDPLEISRIYLLKRFHSKGYGRTLLKACLDVARERRCDAVWLSVWKHNPNAIGFYEKMGFQTVGKIMFDLAGTLHEDHVMVKEIVSGEQNTV